MYLEAELIIGVCGSPRKRATEHVLREALRILEERGFQTDFFTVRGKNIGFCAHCDHCLRNEGCVVKDDMQELYPLLEAAEGVVMASPVYNSGVSAQMKAVMDRCRALLASNPSVFKDKPGIAIAVGGDRSGGQELALQQIIDFYILNGIIPLSGGSFGANLGATFWSQDTIEGLKTDEEGFKSLRKTITRLTRFLEGSG